MDTTTRFTVVVGVDFSDTSERALREALDLATRHDPTDLHLVSVVDDLGSTEPADASESEATALARSTEDSLRKFGDRVMEEVAKEGRTVTVTRRLLHVRVGAPAEEIVKVASDFDADMVVVGTHGRRGLPRLLLGSVAERVLRLARCPVLVVRPKPETEPLPVPEEACPDCVDKRRRTGGQEWWCAAHAEPKERPHTYFYTQESPFPRSEL